MKKINELVMEATCIGVEECFSFSYKFSISEEVENLEEIINDVPAENFISALMNYHQQQLQSEEGQEEFLEQTDNGKYTVPLTKEQINELIEQQKEFYESEFQVEDFVSVEAANEFHITF